MQTALDMPVTNISSKNNGGAGMKKLSEIVSKETHREIIEFLLETSIKRRLEKEKETKSKKTVDENVQKTKGGNEDE